MNIALILTRKYPNTTWTTSGDDYENLNWLDKSPKPTEAELEKLWPEVQFEFEYEIVEKTRANLYREISDPIFFQYQRGTATEKQWLDAVKSIKESNPYPEA
jgi:hypothetical protein